MGLKEADRYSISAEFCGPRAILSDLPNFLVLSHRVRFEIPMLSSADKDEKVFRSVLLSAHSLSTELF